MGGRLKSVNIDGNEYEAGGSVIHEKNLYMKRFADELGESIFLCNEKHSICEVRRVRIQSPYFSLSQQEHSYFIW